MMKTAREILQYGKMPILASMALALLALSAGAANLQLVPGTTQKVDVPGGVKKITVSNPSVADAKPSSDGKSVIVTCLEEGTSDIRVEALEGADVTVTVKSLADVGGLAEEIRALLSEVEGLTVKQVGSKVVLDGSLMTKSDYDRVSQVAEAYSGAILNLVKLDRKELNQFVAEAIQTDIGMDTVTVRVSGDTATLEGIVYDEADVTRATEVAKMRVPTVVNLIKVQEVMIETDVYFVQVDTKGSKSTGYNILKGASIDAGASISGGSGEGPTTSFNVSGNVSARINALVGAGDAKVLAQPHLSTKSGDTGRFHSGGETYFSVTGVNAGNLEKVEYGVILTVKPVLRGRDRVMNEITIEVSIPNAQAGGTFALDKFDTTSTTLCKTGESILISGLVQTLESRFKEKTPLLGDVPLLSMFFAEKSSGKQNRELVVVITPTPVFPEQSKTAPLSEQRRGLLNEEPAKE
ncbi:MAG: pilus assembly protein N-terminal domain-containing protein [Lentisphaerae bacterium]|nr:pilus assembly protein N-terminal domain-containing protein [Lentisphaerota bacterium]